MNINIRWKLFLAWWETNYLELWCDETISKDRLVGIIERKISDLKKGIKP